MIFIQFSWARFALGMCWVGMGSGLCLFVRQRSLFVRFWGFWILEYGLAAFLDGVVDGKYCCSFSEHCQAIYSAVLYQSITLYLCILRYSMMKGFRASYVVFQKTLYSYQHWRVCRMVGLCCCCSARCIHLT